MQGKRYLESHFVQPLSHEELRRAATFHCSGKLQKVRNSCTLLQLPHSCVTGAPENSRNFFQTGAKKQKHWNLGKKLVHKQGDSVTLYQILAEGGGRSHEDIAASSDTPIGTVL